MALPPVNFQRARRDPSLVEQALVGTLASFANKKFITDPAARDREEFLSAERLAQQQFTTERDIAQADRATVFAEHTDRLARERAKEEFDREKKFIEAGTPDVVLSAQIGTRLAEIGNVDVDALIPGVQHTIDPEDRNPRSLATTVEQLRGVADAVTRQAQVDAQNRATDARTSEVRDTVVRDFINQARVAAADLPPMMYDDGTGPRFLTGDEQATRGLAEAGYTGEAGGYANDPRIQGMVAKFEELEPNLVQVPGYSAAGEIELLGKLSQPGSENMFFGLMGPLVGAEVVGKDFDWFINNQGEKIEVKGEAELLDRMPTEASSHLKASIWSSAWFQDLDQFERGKDFYNISDEVAERTYRRIQGVGPPPPELGGGVGDAGDGDTEPEPFVTFGARQLAENKDDAETLRLYTDSFVADSTAYDDAVAEFDRLFALPDEELRTELENLGMLPPVNSSAGTGGGASGGIGGEAARIMAVQRLPERDRLRVEAYSILTAARIEAEARRRNFGAGGETPTPFEPVVAPPAPEVRPVPTATPINVPPPTPPVEEVIPTAAPLVVPPPPEPDSIPAPPARTTAPPTRKYGEVGSPFSPPEPASVPPSRVVAAPINVPPPDPDPKGIAPTATPERVPAAKRDTGITPGNRVYEKNGAVVVDTPRPDSNDMVPTHRVSQRTNRRPNETWEAYEDRVIARDIKKIPAAVTRVSELESDVRVALIPLIGELERQGAEVEVRETYRSQNRQEALFQVGRQPNDRRNTLTWTLTSAHTTRRAVDLVINGDTTGSDPMYDWLQEHAQDFGFVTVGSANDRGHISKPQ